jgi:cytidylate kinase
VSSSATSSEARIAISGKSGCGNTSVTRIVGERLGLRVINYTFKNMAAEMGITFEELRELAERDDRFDRQLDSRQVELAAAPGCVLGSRLAMWLLADADLKVYLDGTPQIRAARVARREGTEPAETLAETIERDRRDRQRYLRLYSIDIDRFDHADVVVDTSLGDEAYVARRVIVALQERLRRRSAR